MTRSEVSYAGQAPEAVFAERLRGETWHEDPRAEREFEPSDLARIWLSGFLGAGQNDWLDNAQSVMDAVGIPLHKLDGATAPMADAACDLGMFCGRIVIEGAQWRFALPDERAIAALILPVSNGEGGWDRRALPMSVKDMGEIYDEFAAEIDDLVAVPIGGGKAYSFNGVAASVGYFGEVTGTTITLFASGMAWLRDHLARVGNPDLAHCDITRIPGVAATLILNVEEIEWRPSMLHSEVSSATKEIVCADSRGLAARIDAAMKKKDRVPALPKVLGPKVMTS